MNNKTRKNSSSLRSMALFSAITCITMANSFANATTLVNTETDFSLAGQGVNGLQYGYYTSAATTGTFTTAGMYAFSGGPIWYGLFPDNTPVFTANLQHEVVQANASVVYSAVRRYTFSYTGTVYVNYQMWKVPFGSIGNGADEFITFNGTQLVENRVPNGSTEANPSIYSSLQLTVAPGETLDFGTTDHTGDGTSDVTGFAAEIYTTPVVYTPPGVSPIPDQPALSTTLCGVLTFLGMVGARRKMRA